MKTAIDYMCEINRLEEMIVELKMELIKLQNQETPPTWMHTLSQKG